MLLAGVCVVSALVLSAACTGFAAPPAPVWIAPAGAVGDRASVRFASDLTLPSRPDRAVVRVSARDRFTLRVDGRPVTLGDSATPWVFDVSGALKAGSNHIEVDVQSDLREEPDNAWVILEKRLAGPTSADRLALTVESARADEWLYVEVMDAGGNTSGYYCVERGRPELKLDTDGARRTITLELRRDTRLGYRGSSPCDFDRIVAVRVRVDQKSTRLRPVGGVRFVSVRLIGGQVDAKLSARDGWSLLPGSGDVRKASIGEAAPGFRLAYDFRPTRDPRLAFDLRAFRGETEIGRLVSGTGWKAGDETAGVVPRPAEHGPQMYEYWPIDIRDAREIGADPMSAMVDLDAGGVDRTAAGKPIALTARVRALDPRRAGGIVVRVVDWSDACVAEVRARVDWSDGEGSASLIVPALPRGLYWLTAQTTPAARMHERGLALAVLGDGEKRLSALFDTLRPFAKAFGGLQGVDLSYQDSPALLMGLRRLGVNFLQFHLDPGQIDNGELDELIGFCKATQTRFALNNETSNWSPSALSPDGRERFAASGGCHRWDIEAPALRKAAASGLFEGVVYDEGEHMQLCRNAYSSLPDPVRRKPYLVETTGMTLPEAYDAFLASARTVAAYNRQHGARMLVESVFPVLWHPLARAGVTLCPKLLKEDVHPVVLAQALGAAKQYDCDLWFSPDLWHLDQLPGHSVREYAAALRLAHEAGVDNVYTEFVTCLVHYRGPHADITPYGRALQEHIRTKSAKPLPYTFRDYRPEVAIVRFPDSDWGQASCGYWNTLYGAENLQSTEATREWHVIWHHLTGGATSDRALNTNSGVYHRYDWRFIYPAPAVAIFDHRVDTRCLDGVKTIYLCGITVTAEALDAVRQAVRAGAKCYAARRLCPPDIAGASQARVRDGKGEWIVVEAFRPGMEWPAAPRPGDRMRLRFDRRTIPITEP